MSQKRELPKSLPMGERTIQLRAQKAAPDSEEQSYPLTLATDEPVKRQGWFGWYYEVLGHEVGEVNTGRLGRGLSLLVNHDMNQRAGKIDDGKVEGGKTTGKARFNGTDFGQSVKREVDDGTLTDMSVGYLVHEYKRVADIDPDDDEDEDYLGTYRATNWEPVEGSLVAIPADVNSGLGRSAEPASVPQYPVRFHGAPAKPPADAGNSKEQRMATANVTPNPEATAPVTVGPDQLQAERKRSAHISLLARQYPEILTREKADEFIHNGTGSNDVAAFVLEQQRSKQIATNAGGPVQLTEKERKQYSIQRLVKSVAGGFSEEAGFEREVSEEIGKKLGRGTAGVFMPTHEPLFRLTPQEIQKRALYTGASASGGATVATELVSFLDVLRPAVKAFKLGADFMGGMSSNFALPKMLTDSDFNWVGENPGVDNTDVDPTFGQVAFSPKTATGSTSWSRQLLIQSSIDVEAKVRNSLVQRAAIAIDKAALAGSGTANQPTGILNATGVSVESLGTNGAAPTFQNLIDMITTIATYNADTLGDTRYLLTPEIAGYLQGQPMLANTIALPIWQNVGDQGYINGHKADWSNLLPKNLAKGTGTNLHAGIAGVFNCLTIAEWGAMEILLDPYTKAKQALVNIIANFMVDVNPTYAQAFTVYLDAVNSTSVTN